MKPVVAMPQMGTSLFRQYMKSKYVYSLESEGAVVQWIELLDPYKAVQQSLRCDALLLPGGADIAPELYGRKREEKCGKANLMRDSAEPAMFRAFLQTGKPILCICRGMQMMNVCLGGTLTQDISARQQYKHSDFFSRSRSCHPCTVIPDSHLFSILQETDIAVNSMHHQAVDKLGNGLAAAAVSADGFVEALELPQHPFCIGVQWHPEHMYQKSMIQRRIFEAFVNAAKEPATYNGGMHGTTNK